MVMTVTADHDVDDLSSGEAFELLCNQRRRYVLHYLKRDDQPVELGTLAQHVAAWEYETTPEEVTSEQRKRVYTTLQQTHLPKLDETGILEFDDETGIVRGTDRTHELNVYLEVVPGNEIAWHEVYLAIGAVSCALVAALWVEVYPLTLLSTLGWAVVIALTLTITALAHAYHERGMRLGHGDRPPELRYDQ